MINVILFLLVDEPRRAYSGAGDREAYRRAGQGGGDRGPDKKADAGAGTATFEFVSEFLCYWYYLLGRVEKYLRPLNGQAVHPPMMCGPY